MALMRIICGRGRGTKYIFIYTIQQMVKRFGQAKKVTQMPSFVKVIYAQNMRIEQFFAIFVIQMCPKPQNSPNFDRQKSDLVIKVARRSQDEPLINGEQSKCLANKCCSSLKSCQNHMKNKSFAEKINLFCTKIFFPKISQWLLQNFSQEFLLSK